MKVKDLILLLQTCPQEFEVFLEWHPHEPYVRFDNCVVGITDDDGNNDMRVHLLCGEDKSRTEELVEWFDGRMVAA
jgi:hypothetical protein